MNKFNFSQASDDETLVFGASRPGYPKRYITDDDVTKWIKFMKENGINTIVVLLDESQLNSLCYNLLDRYKDEFGRDNVYHIPVTDYTYIDKTKLHNYLFPILEKNWNRGMKSLIHCAGGIGRTGHILSAWLVHKLNYSIIDAIDTVKSSGRDPLEATYEDEQETTLIELLKSCE